MKLNHTFALIVVAGIILTISLLLHADSADQRVVSAAKQTYVFKYYLKDDCIKTECKDGVVTLTGIVGRESHKALAQDTVRGLPGVKSVDNQLEITSHTAEDSDLWTCLNVKSVLLFHRSVRGTEIDVSVRNGNVVLSGEVSSQAKKELTIKQVYNIQNVKEVKNMLTIAMTGALGSEHMNERIDDASVTAMVKFLLKSQRLTGTPEAQVESRNGVVTLRGVARNTSEKSMVTRIATDTTGVTSVVNNMTIERIAMLNNGSGLRPPQNLRTVRNSN